MKLIKSSFEILEQAPGLEGIYEAIERAARVCYKSSRPEGKTAKDFVDMLIKRRHLSPLEHGTVYLKYTCVKSAINILQKYRYNPYSRVDSTYDDLTMTYYTTTNMRVLYENGWLDDLKYLCEPTEYHEKRIEVKVNCSIGISREWNRHRALATTEDMKSINDLEFSVCEQSTRYCNYSLDKFDNELTFIVPSWIDDISVANIPNFLRDESYDISFGAINFAKALYQCERSYLTLIKEGATPQQAREVLPLATATEVIYTGYIPDWEHFFDMRCDNAAHPDIRKLAIPLKEEFIKRGYIE